MARRAIDQIEEALSENRRFFALEFFPPKTAEGESNLYPRIEKLSRQLDPLWCGLTLGESAEHSLSIGQTVQSVLSVDMQLNVTASAFPSAARLTEYLDRVKGIGIRNLLLLRGVTPPPADGDFQNAADLVRFVRNKYGSHFCLAVAGHPLGYDDDTSTYDAAVANLKAKVDAGADLVISSMCFSAPVFLKFCADCHAHGIHCPVLPGIMPIQSRAQFRHWFDKPGCEDLRRRVDEANRHDDAEVKRIGVQFTTALLKQLFRGGVRGAYFFTMNMEAVVSSIVAACGLNQRAPKELPWRQSADMSRSQREQQRPIYWSGRPTSYMARTLGPTDDFPNGRYGDSMSPAFGENTTYHTALALSAAARRCHWMFACKSLADVCAGFVAFLEGRGRLPWCEESLAPEAEILLDSTLLPLNRRGLLTINSQPAANGLASDDPQVGWGPPGGFVYQKQYLEFFCSRDVLRRVLTAFATIPSLAVMALDSEGNSVDVADVGPRAGPAHDPDQTTTVTWGVFPNRPVLQPTTLSLAAFRAWAPEAFSLWRLPFLPAANASSQSPPGSSNASASSPNSGSQRTQPPPLPSVPTSATAAGDAAASAAAAAAMTESSSSGGAAAPGSTVAPPSVKFTPATILRAEGFPASMPAVLQAIAAEWVLVSVVDNDFISSPTHLDRAVAALCAQLPELSPNPHSRTAGGASGSVGDAVA